MAVHAIGRQARVSGLSAYQTSWTVRRIAAACLAWATMPRTASTTNVRYQPQPSVPPR